jgi:UDP-N-acetylglucosamine transferase subunit ALG13
VIIVTVGMQLGFDRLIEAMDALAPKLGMDVLAQTGKGHYTPRHMEHRKSIPPAEFEALVQDCRLIVSHAGIGTVLTAQRASKPIVLMPRRAKLGEHRNDHQLATTHQLDGRPGIVVARDESELAEAFDKGLALEAADAQRSLTADRLERAVGRFISEGTL